MTIKNLCNKKNLATVFGLSFMFSVYAENVKFQNVHVGGSGCPGEKTQIVFSPDLSQSSIIFQNFESHVPAITTGPKASPYISQLPCNVFVEVKLPIGQKLESLEIRYDMRGNTSLDKGVVGSFKSFLVSAAGMGTERGRGRNPELLQEKNWINSSLDQFEDFLLQTSKTINFGSDCRASTGLDTVYIQLQHHIYTQITRGNEQTNAQGTITMDSSDMSGGLKLKAITSACTNSGGTPTPPRNCRVVRIGGRLQQICQ